MKKEWVDFKSVKAAVDFSMVLDHYGIKGVTKVGDELRGSCPIHKGSPRSKNFSVNLRKNVFTCFSKDCGARGNVLDFVAAMEGGTVRDAALKLAEWFKIGESQTQSRSDSDDLAELPRGIYQDGDGALYELVINRARFEKIGPVVVYRELFGDYRFLVASPEQFDQSTAKSPTFALVKAL